MAASTSWYKTLPLCFVERDTIRKHLRYNNISVTNFMKYLTLLTALLESKIVSVIPSKFTLTFYGWSCDDTYYVAIFATFITGSTQLYESVLLVFTPFLEEPVLGAYYHFELIDFVLEIYGKTFDDVVEVLGENRSNIRRVARYMDCYLIGCPNHRFILKVNGFISNQDKKIRSPIKSVQTLRKILRKKNISKTTNAH